MKDEFCLLVKGLLPQMDCTVLARIESVLWTMWDVQELFVHHSNVAVVEKEIAAAEQPTTVMFGGLEQERKMTNSQLKPDVMLIRQIVS